jgi:toxin HigB-1
MIRSFRSKPLESFFTTGAKRKLPVQNVARLSRMLRALDAAGAPEDMNLPGFVFHSLKGVSRYACTVTGNWRLTFAWDGADATDVDLEDYH